MSKHYRPTHDILFSLKELLAPNPRRNPEEVLQEVVDQLQDGRGYYWIGLYLAAIVPGGAEQNGTATGGPAYSRGLAQSKPKLVQPIKIGTRILGAIEVEGDHLDAFSSQDRALMEQAAEMLARYLTTDRGKLLLRKTRQNSQTAQAKAEPHKPPQSEYPALSRAAAGERVAR